MTRWVIGTAFVLVGALAGLSAAQMRQRLSWRDRLRSWLAGRQTIFAIGTFVTGVAILVAGIPKH